MEGGRQTITCPSCGKKFTYWVRVGVAQPKYSCYLCGKDYFPNGEPPPEPKPAPVAKPAAPAVKPAAEAKPAAETKPAPSPG